MAVLTSLRARLMTAVILIILIMTALYIKPLLLIFTLIYIVFAANEYARFWHRKEVYPHTITAYLPSLLIPILVYFDIELAGPLFVMFCFIITISVLRFPGARTRPNFLSEIAAAIFGVIFLATMPSTLILLRKIGFYAALLPLLLCWSYDTFAYLAGTMLGRSPLASKISPKKTWEGTIIALFLLFPLTLWLGSSWIADWRLVDCLIVTLSIGILGTIGDLLESAMKREVNLKDSSRIFPGHGGFLDRIDSLILSIPFFYFYLVLRGRI